MASAPNSSQRKKCWLVRDEYFQCLEANNEDKQKCASLMPNFEEHCPKRWVKYFIGLRGKEKLRAKIEKQGVVYTDDKN